MGSVRIPQPFFKISKEQLVVVTQSSTRGRMTELHMHLVPNQDISTWKGVCWTPFMPHSSTTETASPPALAQDSSPGQPCMASALPHVWGGAVCVHRHPHLHQYPQRGPHITTQNAERSRELRSGDRKLGSGSAQVYLAPENLIQQKGLLPCLHALFTSSASAHQIFTRPGLWAGLRGQHEGGGWEIRDAGYRLPGGTGLVLPSAVTGALWASTSSSGK